jgi:two-component system OmpR family sensor kinase
MGRLFWKILLTFWLTLLTTGGASGIAVWLHQRTEAAVSEQSPAIPPPPPAVIGKNHRPPHHFPFGLFATGVIASFVSSFLLAWYFSQPIGILRKAFRAAAKGDLSQRVTPTIGSRRDEIADLGRDFDDMATQLQTLMISQRRLLHDVSHELRSPLARLQASIGLAHQQPEKVASSLARIEHEAGRLDKLVGEVLTLSRLESGVPQPLDEYIDILELADAVIDDARFEANALSRQVVFQCDVEDNPIIQGHGELLYRALENVVRNAIHHTPANTAVTLAIHHDAASSLHLTVDDQGSGVPEAELGSIFEPFQRSSNVNPSRNGYGLGLAIARRAIESHGGTIRAKNLASGGLRVDIYLPLTTAMA